MGSVGKREHHLSARLCVALDSDNADKRTTSDARPRSCLSCPSRLKITRDPRDEKDEREVADNAQTVQNAQQYQRGLTHDLLPILPILPNITHSTHKPHSLAITNCNIKIKRLNQTTPQILPFNNFVYWLIIATFVVALRNTQ